MEGLLIALFLPLAVTTLSVGRVFTGLTALMLAGTAIGFALARSAVCRLAGAWRRLIDRLRASCNASSGMPHAIQHLRRSLSNFRLTAVIWSTEAAPY